MSAEDRQLTFEETDEFMQQCYLSALELDLKDCQDLIAKYEMKLQGQNDYIKIMERLQQEREAKLGYLEAHLELLEAKCLEIGFGVTKKKKRRTK